MKHCYKHANQLGAIHQSHPQHRILLTAIKASLSWPGNVKIQSNFLTRRYDLRMPQRSTWRRRLSLSWETLARPPLPLSIHPHTRRLQQINEQRPP